VLPFHLQTVKEDNMWPYAKRGSRFQGDVFERFPSKLGKEQFSINDAVVKLWLPERLVAGIDVLSRVHNRTRPDVIRWVLFEHAFGKVEFALLQERVFRQNIGKWYEGPMFSRKAVAPTARALRVRYLGKSTTDLKVEMPLKLKQEIENLADEAGESLSGYIRRVLAKEFLSHDDYLAWQHLPEE
jgi:predicted DNA-binding protein